MADRLKSQEHSKFVYLKTFIVVKFHYLNESTTTTSYSRSVWIPY